MRLCYVLLSPSLGMQQYTADLANRWPGQVTVVATSLASANRFAPQVDFRPVARVKGTGLQPANFRLDRLRRVYREIVSTRPDVVHFTGPHLWNPLLLWWLRRAGVPTVHTLHDLDPHHGAGYGRLLYSWNRFILRWARHILVHGQIYRERLIAQGLPPERVTYTPLLHLFVDYAHEQELGKAECGMGNGEWGMDTSPFALFFARLEKYKGVEVFVEAMRLLAEQAQPGRAIIAGQGQIDRMVSGPLPANVEIRNRVIADDEAIDLFRRCRLVVLPYVDATQSALIAAAYFFGKPVVVTRAGALPEYVVEGQTGWVVEPGNARALAVCLQQAWSDPDRLRAMGQAGRAWYAAQRASEAEALQRMYGMYRRI